MTVMEKPAAAEAAPESLSPLTRGVHHLVFNTDDMKMTIDFYCGVLGMKLVHALKTEGGITSVSKTRGNPPYENIRHYFFDMGNDSVLAFFEMPKNDVPKADRDAVGGMQHTSFVVTKESQYQEMMKRLKQNGVDFYGPIPMGSGPGYSIYFFDPNGIRLEVSCIEVGTPSVIANVKQTKSEILQELKTLHDDPAWLATVTAGLPD